MGKDDPVALYIAAYDDPDAAQQDWDALKGLVKAGAIFVDGRLICARQLINGTTKMDHTSDIKKDVEDVLPPGTSGIIAMFDITWKPKVDETLTKASKIDKEEVSPESAAKLKEEAAKA